DVSDDIIANINRNPNWQHPTANSINEDFQLPKVWAGSEPNFL
ncbi:7830_t:CDS:2, partial [Rhizophagus irregularis]